jgi:hypothetical protein
VTANNPAQAAVIERPAADAAVAQVARVYQAYLVAGLAITGLWTQLDLSVIGPIALGVMILLDRRPAWLIAPVQRVPVAPRLLPPGLSVGPILLGLFVAAPTWLHLALTWREEFPFSGDEGYHLSAARTFVLHLGRALPAVLATGALVVVLGRLTTIVRRHALTFWMAALCVVSVWYPPELILARYPTAFYFLAAPAHVLAEVAAWRSPLGASHLMNALSIVAWLFVLRPLVVRRWPDLAMLPLAAFLFFYRETTFYFTSASIEPWALVLLLVAIEAAVVLPLEHRWVACLLAGAAALTKESIVFVVPFVWLLSGGVTWRQGRIAVQRRYLWLGVATLLPFVVYFALRRSFEVHRRVGFASLDTVASPARFREWWDGLLYQFGPSGVILLGAVAAYALAGLIMLRRDRHEWLAHASLVAAAAALLVFFFADEMSVPFTAYSRYMLLPLFTGGSILLIAGHRLARDGRRRVLVALAAAIAVLHAAPLGAAIALDFRPEYARNSREWYGVPVYYPVRVLTDRMAADPAAGSVTRVKLISFGIDPGIAPVAYPDVNHRYALRGELQHPDGVNCRCTDSTEAVLAGFVVPAMLTKDLVRDPQSVAAEVSCLAQIRETCRNVLIEAHDTGAVAGALGTGLR